MCKYIILVFVSKAWHVRMCVLKLGHTCKDAYSVDRITLIRRIMARLGH